LSLWRVTGWFYSFKINNWHGLSKRKNVIMKRVEKGFLRLLSGKGRVHYLARKCCVKCAKKGILEEKAEKG
jgi:hypothetical protein